MMPARRRATQNPKGGVHLIHVPRDQIAQYMVGGGFRSVRENKRLTDGRITFCTHINLGKTYPYSSKRQTAARRDPYHFMSKAA